ncbi:MAG: hypothetical protein AAFQ92_18430, partial [Bacteroidota bacterium]
TKLIKVVSSLLNMKFVQFSMVFTACDLRELLIDVDEDSLRNDLTAHFWRVDTIENCTNFMFSKEDTTLINFVGMGESSQRFEVIDPINLPNKNKAFPEVGLWEFTHNGEVLNQITLFRSGTDTKLNVQSFVPGVELVFSYEGAFPDAGSRCNATVRLVRY